MKRKNNKNKSEVEVEEFIIEKVIDNAVLVALKYVPIKKCKRDYTRFYLYDVYKYDTLTNKSIFLYKTCLDDVQKEEVLEDAKNSVDKYLESHN